MELDDTRQAPGPEQTAADSSAEVGTQARFAGLGGRNSDIDVRHRKAVVAAGLFGDPLEPVKIGRFTIVRKLGSGGMGVVYVAYDEQLDRRVAVKLLRGTPSPEARVRFEREAQAMARLSHPNVVTVHEVGTHDDQTFVAMEFVEGEDLRGWMAAEKRDWRAVVELFRQAGEGLAAAHEAGVVHRDFKPDNVLVGKDGRVRVADFGLAHGFGAPLELPPPLPEDSASGSRLEAELTRTGALMGTPAYMAPEQYAGRRSDDRGDQFSFCVALWEGLYGRRPFSGDSLLELSLAITEGELDEPPEDSEVPAWLRAIVSRGLAPQPEDRWPSMRALLDALADDPGLRRRRVAFALGLGVGALALVGAAWLAASELSHNTRQRYWNALTEQLLEIERERGLRQAQDDAIRARDATRMSVLRSYKPKTGVVEHEDPTVAAVLLREVEGEVRRSSEWISTANELLGQPLSHTVLLGHRDGVVPLLFSADGAWLYSASDDGEVRRWDVTTGAGDVLMTHGNLVTELALSPDGQLLASSSHDGTVQVWSALTGESRVVVRHSKPVMFVDFDRAGSKLASASKDGTVVVHDLESGESEVLDDQGFPVYVVRFDADGERVLTGSGDGKVRVWRLDDPRITKVLEGHEETVFHIHVLDEHRVVTASDDGSARLWRLDEEPSSGTVLARHARAITSLDVHGSSMVSAAIDGSIAVVSLDPPHEAVALPPHEDEVWSVAFTPDGDYVASASFDRTARLARADGRGVPVDFVGHRLSPFRVAIDPHGRWLATGSYDSSIRVWVLQQPQLSVPLRGHRDTVVSVAVDRDGERAVTASHDGTARVWSIVDGTELAVLDGGRKGLTHAAFSPDGELVATSTNDKEIDLWTVSGTERRVLSGHEGHVWRLAFDPDGDRLASASYDGTARVWSVSADAEPLVLRGHQNWVIDVAFGHDGARVFTASHDGTVRIWDASTGAPGSILRGHTGKILTLELGPGGRMLASGADDGTARLWAGDEFEEVVVLPGHGKKIWSIAFAADGRRVFTTSDDGRIRIWDTRDGSLLDTLSGHAAAIWSVCITPDDRVITASVDNTIRVWTPGVGGPPIVLSGHDSDVQTLALTPDGRRLISGSRDATAKVWSLDRLTTDPESLIDALYRATNFCLPLDQRIRELGESSLQAARALDACERARGR